MTTRFYCLWKGRKLYRVLSGREELFCGTSDECKRFLELHAMKEEKARAASERPPRRRRPTLRIYRLALRSRTAV